MIIYYVGAEVDFNSQQLLHRHFGTLMPRPHATLVYSRKWFPYKTAKCFPLILEPPYELLLLKESLVLKFENYRFLERHIELRNLGATSDHDRFTPHITIQEGLNFIPNYPLPKFPITLSNEYYGTWEENKE
jgi:hypothetical protein